jgi:hypothetical protein
MSDENVAEYGLVHFSSLRFGVDLRCFVEALQGKSEVGEIAVFVELWRKVQGLSRDLRSFLILPLFSIHSAQVTVR